ncbi:MAG: response regulator [Desulfatiglandaceae bacterium]
MNVLVVETDMGELLHTVELIQQWGYYAEKSETGHQSLAKVREKIFDLVLLDLSLPDTRPQALIPRLKEYQPEIGIVTMTASNSKELENEIRTLGIVYYMIKPVDEGALKDILDHSARKKQKKRMRK